MFRESPFEKPGESVRTRNAEIVERERER